LTATEEIETKTEKVAEVGTGCWYGTGAQADDTRKRSLKTDEVAALTGTDDRRDLTGGRDDGVDVCSDSWCGSRCIATSKDLDTDVE
jgi:hypothetical protein